MIESIFGDQFWWYLARTTGIVAWVLLSASLIWGLLMAAGLVARGTARVLTMEVHRFLGTLAVAFTGLHLVARTFFDNLNLQTARRGDRLARADRFRAAV